MTDLSTTRPHEQAQRHPPPPGQPPGRDRRGRLRRHPVRTAVLVVLVASLGLAGSSYGHALAAPGSDSVGARSVEWVRQHGGSSLVNWIERQWYSHHQPPKGGSPKLGAIPAPAPTATAPPPVPAGRHRAVVPPHLQPPAPIVPLASPPLAGEGSWHPAGSPVQGLPAVYTTSLRPDPVHTSLVTGVAWM